MNAEDLARELGARAGRGDMQRVTPMLCGRGEAGEALERAGWLFELKLDGARVVADKRGGKASLAYRSLRDASTSYPEIAEAVRALAVEDVVLDGEIAAFDEHGRPDFQLLGRRINARGRRASVPVVYVVFDVLAIGPYDVRGLALEARKEILARLLPAGDGLLRLQPTFENGVDLFRLCREQGLEGVVAKRLGSTYRTGERTEDWLKIKCERDADLVVVGWTEGESTRARLGALDIASYEGERLVYRGRVGSGIDEASIDDLVEVLVPLEVPRATAEGTYAAKAKRHHCRPEVVVSVRYSGFTSDAMDERVLWHPVFRGMRPDVTPRDCTVAPEEAGDLADAVRPSRSRRLHVNGLEQIVHGTITKGALCTYFEAVAAPLLRHARGHACELVRTDGTVLWPPPRWTPKLARTAEKRGFLVDSVDFLLFAVEAGAPILQRAAGRSIVLRAVGGLVAALEVRDLAAKVGLPAAAIAVGPGIEVIVGVGDAPASVATAFAALFAQVAGGAARVVPIASASVAFSPCVVEGRLYAAVPLPWEELAAFDLDGAAARAAHRATDAWLDGLEAEVDLAAALAAIEAIVTRG